MRVAIVALLVIALMPSAAQQAAPQQKAPQEAPAKKAEPAAEPAKPAAPPPEPSERRRYNYVYDLQDRAAPGNPATSERRSGTGAGAVVEREESIRDFHGRPVTAQRSQEKVLSQNESDRSSERTVQRYDPTGRPASRQLVRTERRRMPEGSTVTTETTYDHDLNGRMQFTERRTSTEHKSDAGGSSVVLVERPSIQGGGAQVVERIDRTETRRGEAVTETASSRKFRDANGRFEERERESGLVTRSGNQTTTETKQWQLGATGQMDFVSRSLSRKTQTEGGEVEDTEVYSTKIAGATPDLNRPQVPTLEQQSRREKKVGADGKVVETTSTRLRQVAEPSRLGGLVVEESIATPTAEGRTVQRSVSERDANGRVRLVSSSVEHEKK